VLHDLSFTLEPGDFRYIVGPSGAGKTSLLRLLYLAHRPSRGLVSTFGVDVTTASRDALAALRRRIGVVFQDFRLLDHLSALDNVALPLRVQGVDDGQVREHVSELLTWVGLAEHLHARPPTLSGGQKQRVAIARALITRPKLLLADEPTGNLDEAVGRRLLHLFEELNKIGTTVVIATHNEAMVAQRAHPVLRLRSGTLSLAQPAAAD
jgi:cell division transport system ATP-binding protein